MTEFCCCSSNDNNMFFEQLGHITFKLRRIITNTLKYLDTLPFLGITSITNATSLTFLVLRVPATLYLDAISTPGNIFL